MIMFRCAHSCTRIQYALLQQIIDELIWNAMGNVPVRLFVPVEDDVCACGRCAQLSTDVRWISRISGIIIFPVNWHCLLGSNVMFSWFWWVYEVWLSTRHRDSLSIRGAHNFSQRFCSLCHILSIEASWPSFSSILLCHSRCVTPSWSEPLRYFTGFLSSGWLSVIIMVDGKWEQCCVRIHPGMIVYSFSSSRLADGALCQHAIKRPNWRKWLCSSCHVACFSTFVLGQCDRLSNTWIILMNMIV